MNRFHVMRILQERHQETEAGSLRPYGTELNWGDADPGFHPGLLSCSPSGRDSQGTIELGTFDGR